MLFFNDDMTERERIVMGLAELGGTTVGLQAGKLATIPIDAAYQKRLFKKGLERSKEKQESAETWKTLLDLQKGKINIEDLPETDREFFSNAWAENKKDLEYLSKRPHEAHQLLKKTQSGTVTPILGVDPKTKMTGFFPKKVRAPYGRILPSALGIAGFIGAGNMYTNHLKNQESQDE